MSCRVCSISWLLLVATGCQTPRDTLAPPAEYSLDPAADTERAWKLFDPGTRDQLEVQRALEVALLAAAAHEDQAGQVVPTADRVARLCLAVRCAIWLAQNAEAEELQEIEAERAVVLANTACELSDESAEAYYLRAVATGLYAERNVLTGKDAMTRIQSDGRRAIRLDESVDGGGPHRVLGGLYLRAPGAPAGVGSLRRAERELQKAYEIDGERIENLLFLAELRLEQEGETAEITELLDRAAAAIGPWPDPVERDAHTVWLNALRSRLGAR